MDSNLADYQTTYQEFTKRFSCSVKLVDCFGREYFVCFDNQKGNTAIFKNYMVQKTTELEAVLENLTNFKELGKVKGICKLLNFCHQNDKIIAAFQYGQYLQHITQIDNQAQEGNIEMYFNLLQRLIELAQQLHGFGLDLDSLNFIDILYDKQSGIIKFLFDERLKDFQQIFESQNTELFWSPQKINQQIFFNRQFQDADQMQIVFQIGLLMLHFIYEMEIIKNAKPHDSSHSILLSDSSIERNRKKFGWYLLEQDYAMLNYKMVTKKIQTIKDNRDDKAIRNLLECVQKMVEPISKRSKIQQIKPFAKLWRKQYEQEKKSKKINPFLPFEISKSKNNLEIKAIDSLEYSKSLKECFSLNNISTNPSNICSKVQLPAEELYSLAKLAHQSIIKQLETVINNLSKQEQLIKKTYFDGSVYYGLINKQTEKRQGQGLYMSKNGDICFGSWTNGTLLNGTYLFKNGESFEGNVKKGKQGSGRYRYQNGMVYEGNWKDDVKEGYGTSYYPNGDIYEGNWKNGKKDGQGSYKYQSGMIFKGTFVKGKKKGKGVLYFPDSTKIQGQWAGYHLEGMGKLFHANGEYFEGNYHFSEKDGQGKYKWEQCQYQGNFKKDQLQGEANIKYSNGQTYVGYVNKGKRQGEGKYQYNNGDLYQGQWRNDEKNVGKYIFSNGDVFQGKFKQGQIHFGVMTYLNGQSYQGEFSDSQRHGVGCYKDMHGNAVLEGYWVNDNFVGESKVLT